jgi:hypothetical protein
MAARNSTGKARPVANHDGIQKIDILRALVSGAIAIVDVDSDEPAQEVRILLEQVRHEAQVARFLFEGFSLEEAERETADYEGPDTNSEAANGHA